MNVWPGGSGSGSLRDRVKSGLSGLYFKKSFKYKMLELTNFAYNIQ